VRILLDVHIAKRTVEALRRRRPLLEAQHISAWRGGAYLRAGDPEILTACHEDGLVFVTYDQRTIPELLRRWASEERPHSGVIFGDKNTVPPDRPGVVAAAVASLANEIGESTTLNMVRYLRRAKG
jgi:hypothetical protein